MAALDDARAALDRLASTAIGTAGREISSHLVNPDGPARAAADLGIVAGYLCDRPEPATVPTATVLGMHMDAMATLLVNTGDMTPWGAMLLRQAIREHLPGVTFEGD